jgi:flagellar protein FlbD
MIALHRLNDEEFILNSNHIELIEVRMNTLIILTNEKKYLVKESAGEVIEKVRQYQKSVLYSEYLPEG